MRVKAPKLHFFISEQRDWDTWNSSCCYTILIHGYSMYFSKYFTKIYKIESYIKLGLKYFLGPIYNFVCDRDLMIFIHELVNNKFFIKNIWQIFLHQNRQFWGFNLHRFIICKERHSEDKKKHLKSKDTFNFHYCWIL